jgi:hypothetical protein
MTKLVLLCLDTRIDTVLPVRECGRQHRRDDNVESQSEANGANGIDGHHVSVVEITVLPSLVFHL